MARMLFWFFHLLSRYFTLSLFKYLEDDQEILYIIRFNHLFLWIVF